MSTITFDFRHYYRKGERRESDQIAYQWDLGHVAEIYVPVNATYEIHYCFADFMETDDYAVESTTAAEDGGYKLTAHIPNKYFERSGELKVYVIGSDDNHVLTTYEGYISIRGRIKPDDYTDDDPENEATRILAEAREARDAAIEAAEQAEAAASQSAAQASIAEVYDATKTYAIGDYCLHDGQLYECTAEITTPEAWTAAHWTAATVGMELNDIKGDVTGLKEEIVQNNNAKGYAIKTFNTVSGSVHSSSNDKVYLDVKSGQKYYVTLSTGDGQSVATQFYANGSRVADVQANGTKREYTAASDLSYFSVNIPSPNTTTYTMLIETDKSTYGITGKYDELNDQVQEIKTFNYEFSADGYYFNTAAQEIESDSRYKYTKIGVSLYRGSKIYGTTAYVPDDPAKRIAFVDDNDTVITSYANPNTGKYKFAYNLDIPETAVYVYIPLRIASESDWVAPSFRLNTLLKNLGADGDIQNKVTEIGKKTVFSDVPALRNGSMGNGSNANAVTTKNIVPIKHNYDYAVIRFNGDESLADSYAFSCAMFKNTADGLATSAVFSDVTNYPRRIINENNSTKVATPYIVLPVGEFEGYKHLAVHVFRYMSGTLVPIRIATDQYSISISYFNELQSEPLEVQNKLKNARHIKGNAIAPLTLLHFSDIHADKAATGRIINDSKKFGTNIDGIICTGDIVNNTAGEIASWWYPQVMTCIGNHDCASYSSETGYDWTALSMADRDAYYIAPFESNWGIVHTSGTSYYYKDYSTQKIRLIVMDIMLYNDNGAEATEQTAWLEELLTSAITNNLHVIIATHAPHGGATAKDCSFSRYGQTAMPTNTDCNTPQVVIDTVATKITAGLKFIGYLVGHTHQDNIWDAEDDGKQLMYCITCGIVSQNAQWRNSDQNRDNTEDAYNLVTIDTANTLVKIVRGGGANIDDHMRTRKAICFNYSTGQMVGEVL